MDQYIGAVMKLDLSWNSRAVPASQLSRWMIIKYDNWKDSALAHIILQDLPFNWQLVKNTFWKVLCWKKCYSRSWFYIDQWILGGVMLMIIVFEKQDDKSHLWYPVKPPLLPDDTLRTHNTATVTWGTFPVIFFHDFSGPRTSVKARLLSSSLTGQWWPFSSEQRLSFSLLT